MKLTVYNKQQLETVIEDLRKDFDRFGKINILYDKGFKEKTKAQIGFTFAALINQITAYFQDCGFNVEEDDVRYKLYEDVSQVVPEMVVDKQLFGGKPRIKHIPEMDRETLSKFINGVFEVLDTVPIYAGVALSPDVFYNWAFHLDPEDIRNAQQAELPERDPEYLEYIRTRPCLCCGKQHRSDAHHLKDNRLGGISQKSPDWSAMPLCHNCHLNIAHGEGFKEAVKWLPLPLDVFTRLCYLRWKNNL